MMSEANSMAENPGGKRDDFQRIKGIGPSIAQALYDSGVHRFADLTEYSAEELVNLLSPKVGFMTIQRIERDDWLGQAKRFGVRSGKNAKSSEVVKQPLLLVSEKSDTAKTNNQQRQDTGNWLEIADFFVSFGQALDAEGEMRICTRVHHSQADHFEQWDGIATNQMVEWMLKQAKIPTSGARTGASVSDASVSEASETEHGVELQSSSILAPEEEAQVEISDLWVSQVETPALVDGVPLNGRLRLESKITLSGPDALHLTYERIPYNIQVYLVDAETSQSNCASIYTGQLSPEELSYMVEQDFPTPRRGRYQVNVIGQMNLPGEDGSLRTLFSYLQGPILRVGV
jgi:hypothetical protein